MNLAGKLWWTMSEVAQSPFVIVDTGRKFVKDSLYLR
jgi:hypothetical protein